MRCLVLACLAGCISYIDSVHVRVRDPERVAVSGVLAAGEARGDIPETAYVNEPVRGSWVARSAAALDVWCPDCAQTHRDTIALAPELVLPADAFRLLGDRLHLRYELADASGPVHQRHGGRWHERRSRIALDLETPLDNVESIEVTHIVSRGLDPAFERKMEISGLVWGAMWIAGGAALSGLGVHERDGMIAGSGLAMVAVGAVLVWLEARSLRAHDTHRTLTVR